MEYPAADIRNMIAIALAEDIGTGDVTSELLIPGEEHLRAKLIAKERGIVCGLRIIEDVYSSMVEDVAVETLFEDGDEVEYGDIIARIDGPARTVLGGERVILNFICRLSGVATAANRFAKKLEGTRCEILDTRKTTPGLRLAEKYAVSVGGGGNHRIGLWDMILIKENHIEAAGGIRAALDKVYEKGLPDVPVEIEVKNIEELQTAMEFPLDRIMLDNFDTQKIKKAIQLREKAGKHIPFEASGGITLENCREYAESGIEFISSGSITHSVKVLDISMIADERYYRE
jgi:nicotinate-nucleotide pyrophosphorylase (carboxylating)